MTIGEDDFSTSGEINPAASAVAITPADSDLAKRTRAIYVGVGGNLTVTMAEGGNIVTFVGVVSGSVLPLRVTQIRLTGTSAGSIVALS